MRLGLFEYDRCPEETEAAGKGLADRLIDRENTLLRGNHHDAIRDFIRMKNRPPARGTADNIDPRSGSSGTINFVDVLVPAKGDRRRIPSVDTDNERAVGRDKRMRQTLVVLHVERAGPTSGITKLPEHLVVGVAGNDTARAARNKGEYLLNFRCQFNLFLHARNRL